MIRPHPVRWLRDHPGHADALLAAVVVAVSIGTHLADHSPDVAAPDAGGVVLTILATAPLAWRRRFTSSGLVMMTAAQAAMELRDQAGPGWLGVLIGAYSLGAHRSGARLKWSATAFVVGWVAFNAVGVAIGKAPWGSLVSTALVFPAAIVFGDSMRRRRERLEHLAERAERAERERELLAHQQVHLERTRIARELHDVVAHNVSAMVIQAGAARRQMKAHPDQAEQALLSIESAGRQAMIEMRRILGVLRSDAPDAELAPQPCLAAIGALVADSIDLPVQLLMDSEFAVVPPSVELSAYRVVQEALTNVRRHAGPVEHVQVCVHREPLHLSVEIEDDGRGASVARDGSGFGLVGMRERTSALGGELIAGPRSGGGWRVRATFPLATQ
jgi:signal transduction histidine kinase